MGDIEFISELLIGTLHGPQGGSASVIDAYYAQYEDFEDEFPDQKRTVRVFKETLAFVHEILKALDESSRWHNKTDFYPNPGDPPALPGWQ